MSILFEIVKQYFKKISLLLQYPTITVEYPYVLKPVVKESRLEIRNNFDECTVCHACEKVCPVKAIEISSEKFSEQVKRPKNSKGQLFEGYADHFSIDYNQCVFCGLCVENCPAQSLGFERTFVRPQLAPQALRVDLVHIPRSMRRIPNENKPF